ncbi:MAG: sugar ABC transporter ATP-binding protein [Oscillospiraceae bacterium]|nr:sugar ABC transporter ATP-binding protein [Oscillospiraceae bacterium]
METLVEMKGIRKSFYGVEVLHAVDFDVAAGEVVALCGENGAGKSTLVKVFAGVHDRDAGEILLSGKKIGNSTPLEMQHKGVSMIHQELVLAEEMTVAQNIYLSREPTRKLGFIDFAKMNNDAKELLESLGQDINPSAKVGDLKIAQKQMVEIAKAISFDVKIIIMDEPTAVLTNKETEILFKLIKSLAERGIGIIYISHRLGEIVEIADRVTVLRDGYLVGSKNVSEITEREIASMMVGRDVEKSVATNFEGDESDIVIEVKNMSGDILKDINFKAARGEILGFSGLIGAGRTELMEMIFGLRKFDKGEVLLFNKPVKIKSAKAAISSNLGFATEDRKGTGIVPDRSIAENIDYVYRVKNKGSFLSPKSIDARAGGKITDLRVVCTGASQLVKNLSGGNQQKVVLSKWLLSEPDIFIIDEPTRGIDVGARQEIYNIINELAQAGKTIIIVSSDMTEILSICQRIIVMHEGVMTGVLVGDERTEENIMLRAVNVM